MNRTDLTVAVRAHHVNDPGAVLDALLEEIIAALLADDRVTIRGFGTFHVDVRSGYRTAGSINVDVPDRRVVGFRPSRKLRKQLLG